MSEQNTAAQLFDNKFDCYADSEESTLDIMAMTRPTFVKCVEQYASQQTAALQERVKELKFAIRNIFDEAEDSTEDINVRMKNIIELSEQQLKS